MNVECRGMSSTSPEDKVIFNSGQDRCRYDVICINMNYEHNKKLNILCVPML